MAEIRLIMRVIREVRCQVNKRDYCYTIEGLCFYIMQCKNCNRILKNQKYYRREDRHSGIYSFCKDCMEEQLRTTDYPLKEYRGGGRIEFDDNEFN